MSENEHSDKKDKDVFSIVGEGIYEGVTHAHTGPLGIALSVYVDVCFYGFLIYKFLPGALAGNIAYIFGSVICLVFIVASIYVEYIDRESQLAKVFNVIAKVALGFALIVLFIVLLLYVLSVISSVTR